MYSQVVVFRKVGRNVPAAKSLSRSFILIRATAVAVAKREVKAIGGAKSVVMYSSNTLPEPDEDLLEPAGPRTASEQATVRPRHNITSRSSLE